MWLGSIKVTFDCKGDVDLDIIFNDYNNEYNKDDDDDHGICM